ncbi:MAG: phosphate ABC transporter permease PstA [Proteobacteria bacterium]|nr:phosphate ABC transporter permease PstA [Pseudomonadota bacterium]MBS0573864.1 phosphate ABC transporter permease PstA [Pseudomonadota bacterium]
MTPAAPASSLLVPDARTQARNRAEARFRLYGLAAVSAAILMLAVLMGSILSNGLSAFRQSYITIPVTLDAATLDKAGTRDPSGLRQVSATAYGKLIARNLQAALAAKGIATDGLKPKDIAALLSEDAGARLRNMVLADPGLIGRTIDADLLASGRVDGFLKGRVTEESAAKDSKIKPAQLTLVSAMKGAGMIGLRLNPAFLTAPDASEKRPEAAGLGVAIIGSAYMMIVVLALSLPIGVAAAVYLEEFAPRNRFTDLIEVNISNLAAVPSIVFGILGLAAFINFAHLPRSAPLVGGLVLTLMTLPRIIIPARAALKAVPPSIRDAALGIGASRMQTVLHHVLPLAAPGILTGMIIGLAQALGETAPLLLIGMVAFVRDYPGLPPAGLADPATALPVQIYNWTQRADPAFVERASGAIIVLLVFLMLMNGAAILLRRRFERRW